MFLLIEEIGDREVLLFRLGAPLVLQREATLTIVQPDRHDRVVIFGVAKAGQPILGANLAGRGPSCREAAPHQAELNVVELHGVKDAGLTVAAVQAPRPDETVLATSCGPTFKAK